MNTMNLYSQLVKSGISPIVAFFPGITDNIKLVCVDQDKVHNGIHYQTPPDWDTQAVPVATGYLVFALCCM